LGKSLGVNQGEALKIAHRTGSIPEPMSEYVEAPGGKLEIRAVFPDREIRITQFERLA